MGREGISHRMQGEELGAHLGRSGELFERCWGSVGLRETWRMLEDVAKRVQNLELDGSGLQLLAVRHEVGCEGGMRSTRLPTACSR
jgi:hypothetical protein